MDRLLLQSSIFNRKQLIDIIIKKYNITKFTIIITSDDVNFVYLSGCHNKTDQIYIIKYDGVIVTYLLVPKYDKKYLTWNEKPMTKDNIKNKYLVDYVYDSDQIYEIIKGYQICSTKQYDGFKNFINIDIDIDIDVEKMRTIKNEHEIEIIKNISKLSCDAHNHVMQNITPTKTEFQISLLFDSYIKNIGGTHSNLSYPSIVAYGQNASVLHYSPNDVKTKNDLVMIDAGGSMYSYSTDITRTYPMNGIFTKEQKEIYNIVLSIQKYLINLLKPNYEWNKIDIIFRCLLFQKMLEINIIKKHGVIDYNIIKKITHIFCPHSIGHCIGLKVHETCEMDENPKVLKSGMVITIEPGIYFMNHVIENLNNDNDIKEFFNFELINKLRNENNIGGIRIEDVILITDTSHVILSESTPKEIEGIESMMLSDKRQNFAQLRF